MQCVYTEYCDDNHTFRNLLDSLLLLWACTNANAVDRHAYSINTNTEKVDLYKLWVYVSSNS